MSCSTHALSALCAAVAVALAAAVFVPWQRFGIWDVYLFLHSPELTALATELDWYDYDGLQSLEVGNVDSFRRPDGTVTRFDSYRFIDGNAVTEFPAQVRRGGDQPVTEVGEYCERHGLSRALYLRAYARLHALGLSGLSRHHGGSVAFSVRRPGLTFGDSSTARLVYAPTGVLPEPTMPELAQGRWLSAHWYVSDFLP